MAPPLPNTHTKSLRVFKIFLSPPPLMVRKMRVLGSLKAVFGDPSRYYSRGHCDIKNFPKLPQLGWSFRKNKPPKAATIFSSDVTNPYSHKEMKTGTCYPPSVSYVQCLLSAPRVCPARIFVNTTSVSFPLPPLPCGPSFPLSLSSPVSPLARLPLNALYKHTGMETHISHLPWLHFSW